MAISAFQKTVRVKIPVGSEDVVLICRKPNAGELSQFLNARFVRKGRKIESRLIEARGEFIDRILVDAENVEYETAAGERKPLNRNTQLSEEDKAYAGGILGVKVESWKDLIALNWKSSAAMHFEDAAPEDEEDGSKN
ncbi:MAG: hypothetical protein ACE15B_19495 [Bryobacteraceae bacterium]